MNALVLAQAKDYGCKPDSIQPAGAMIKLHQDLRDSLAAWRKWYLIGFQAVRIRYTRSALGQFWISLSFLITVVTLGFVYTYLWKADIYVFMPYLAAGFVFWQLISSCITDGCTTFTASEGYIRAERQPIGMFCFVVLFRNLVIFLHNLVVLVPLFYILHHPINVHIWLILPGLALVMLNMYWITMFLGMICARYRDMPSVVAAVLQIVFFATPILWQPDTISDVKARYVLNEANPLAAILAIVREPMLGRVPTDTQYLVSLGTLVVGWLATMWLFRNRGHRVVYWL